MHGRRDLGVCSHVLDNARLSAFYFGDFVFVAGGSGVYVERFINGGAEICLGSLPSEIGA